MAEQSKLPVRPRQSARARRASSSRVDLLCEPSKRPIANLRGFIEHPGLQMMRDESDNLAAHVEAFDGVDAQSIEQPERRLDARLFMVH